MAKRLLLLLLFTKKKEHFLLFLGRYGWMCLVDLLYSCCCSQGDETEISGRKRRLRKGMKLSIAPLPTLKQRPYVWRGEAAFSGSPLLKSVSVSPIRQQMLEKRGKMNEGKQPQSCCCSNNIRYK